MDELNKFEFINKLDKNHLLKLLAVIILSEGYIREYKHPYLLRLVTLADSKEQHKLFSLIYEKIYKKKPRIYQEKRFNYNQKEKKDFLCSQISSKKAIKE